MPGPPLFFFGLQVMGQFTRKCPPLTSFGSSSFYGELLLYLPIILIDHFLARKIVRKQMGLEDSAF